MIFSFHLILVLVYMLLAWITILWLWGSFLDANEHDPERVRAVMLGILSLATVVEIGLAIGGVVHCWFLVVALLVNFWGGLDALLRYPASHQVESFFVLKQVALQTVKTISFAIGMVAFRNNPSVMLGVLPGCFLGMPLLYLMALPMDPAEQVAKDDSKNVDLALRLWHLAVCPSERKSCIASCRGWLYRGLSAASDLSPWARFVVCAASPEHRRVLRKYGRCV